MSSSQKECKSNSNFSRFFSTDHLKQDLKDRSVRGGFVAITVQIFKLILNIVANIVLARLLMPEDYGLIGMATIITNFITLFNDLGLSLATVQREKIDHAQISTLFWINIILSILITFITVSIAPIIAHFYNEPRLILITAVISIGLFISGLGVQHTALLRRQMMYRNLGLNDLASQFIAVIFALVVAWQGFGYWALIIYSLVSVACSTVGVWLLCDWRPGLPRWNSEIKSMLSFGGNLTGFSIINYFARNLDNVLIGKYWGTQSLGLYSKAYQLLLLPIYQISTPIATVVIPSLSRLQNNPREYREYYLKALGMISFVMMPITIIMATMSEELIKLLLGDQWVESSPIFRILSISSIFQILCNTTGWLYVSSNNTKQLFKWGLFASALIMLSFIIGLPYGPQGVALFYTLSITILTLPCLYYATRNTTITMLDLWSSLRELIITSISIAMVSTVFKEFYFDRMNIFFAIFLNSLFIVISYLFMLFYIFGKKKYYLSILSSLRNQKPTPI